MTIGEMIKMKREALGLTQQELAEKLYVSRQTVSRWESGSRCPDVMTAKKIAAILGVSLDELVPGEALGDDAPAGETVSDTKKMLLAIFLLVLGVWFLVYASVGQSQFLGIAGTVLPFLAAALFLLTYFRE